MDEKLGEAGSTAVRAQNSSEDCRGPAICTLADDESKPVSCMQNACSTGFVWEKAHRLGHLGEWPQGEQMEGSQHLPGFVGLREELALQEETRQVELAHP